MSLRYNIGCFLKNVYHAIPLSDDKKIAISHKLFENLSPLLGWTQPYKNWAATNAKPQVLLAQPETQTVTAPPTAIPSVEASELKTDDARGKSGTDSDPYLQQLFNQAVGSPDYCPSYVPYKKNDVDISALSIKPVAFYLPQFHPFDENDEWWGKGFTEWTNVSKAVPQFAGHYQPHLPGELGFYDLRLPEIMKRQVELAKNYGIYGWCFHFYWFGGKRLLEKPLNQFLQDPGLDLPFCLCWANENWTRRWDGSENEILMAQDHSPEDDLDLIKELAKAFSDPRYIRIYGRPVLIVYRASILPDAKATTERWREHCIDIGIGNPYLIAAQSFEVMDPRPYGFDAAVEFPPHQHAGSILNHNVTLANPEYKGFVLDYRELAEQYCNRSLNQPYTVFKTIAPGWDNEARKPGRGHSFHHFSLSKYANWLDRACTATLEYNSPSENLVFINAWNEWGEGAHLEPDRKYGYGYLEATMRTVARVSKLPESERILVVSHDAFPAGAQFLVKNISRELGSSFDLPVDIVTLGDGPMVSAFEKYAAVYSLGGVDPQGPEARCLADKLYVQGARLAIVNTTASGMFAKILKEVGFVVIALVHELPGMLEKNHLRAHAAALAANSDHLVFAASQVVDGFVKLAPDLAQEKIHIRPQGTYKRNKLIQSHDREYLRHKLRTQLHIEAGAQIVLGVGYGDHRKGVDLFVESGIRVCSRTPNVHFVWVGNLEPGRFELGVTAKVNESSVSEQFHFVGHTPETDIYYAGADVFALTSREDPFPTVVLEALEVGVPVVGFEGAGGFTELLSRDCGLLAKAFDPMAFAACIETLLADKVLHHAFGAHGEDIVRNEFSFTDYVSYLLSLGRNEQKKVSVIVPNFNYARHLDGRIRSIFSQTYPVHEVIVLDDASTDESLRVLRTLKDELGEKIRIAENQTNSGSVFRQWEKGVKMATGDLIWIAEADDLASATFLEEVAQAFYDPEVVMSYCQSKQIDSDGKVLDESYLHYTSEISDKWLHPYKEEGIKEICSALSIKNTIPNVSAVLFRRDAILNVITESIEEISKYKIAGDWLTYCLTLEAGKISFSSRPLNLHRRHAASVTIGSNNRLHMREILEVQRLLRRKYNCPPEVEEAARSYSKKIYEQFGLSKQCPNLEDDHELPGI